MNYCRSIKCCAEILNCRCRKPRDKGTVLTGAKKKKQKNRRGSASQFERPDSNIKLRYEPDIGLFWVLISDVLRYLTSPKIASLVVWTMSLVFLDMHIRDYKKCNLETMFKLNDGKIEQQWRNTSMTMTYNEDCSIQQNPVLANISGIMIFFLTIALGAGLDKYKETLRMYEEITGDIKAMGMLMVHLTFDHEKYKFEGKNLVYKDNVQDAYAKMRYLLASLAPTVKNTLAGGEYKIQHRPSRLSCPKFECNDQYPFPQLKWLNAFEAMSDRKYFFEQKLNMCEKLFFSTTIEYSNYWKDAACEFEDRKTMKWNVKLKPFNERTRLLKIIEEDGQKLDSEIQYALYKKISDIREFTDMDAFECTMTVVLDEIMRLFENGLGFGEDEGSAVASAAIERWNAIYATWGTMASLKTFSEPFAVNLFRMILVGAYAYFMPVGYLKYIGVEEEWVIFMYVGGDMMIFCLMWWLAFAVRNPFRNSFIIKNVNKLAYETQFQVLHLMMYQEYFDNKDYGSDSKYGYIMKKPSTVPTEEPTVPTEEPIIIHPIGYDVFTKNRQTDEEKILEKLLEAINQRNVQGVANNLELRKIIKEALDSMKLDSKLRDQELKKIIERAMNDISEFDRVVLAAELKSIMDAMGPPPPEPPQPPRDPSKSRRRRAGVVTRFRKRTSNLTF